MVAMRTEEPTAAPDPAPSHPSFAECRKAARSVRQKDADRHRQAIAYLRPRGMTGLYRQRPPLSVLLYLLGRQGLLIWQAPDEFAVLRPPDTITLPGDRRTVWPRRLDRWWDLLVVWFPPFLVLMLSVPLAFAPTLRLWALLLALLALLYTVTAMLVPLLYGLLKFCHRLVGSAPRHRQESQRIIAQNWSLSLFHVNADRVENLLELTLAHVAAESRKTPHPAAILTCDIRGITKVCTREAACGKAQVTSIPDTDLLIIRRSGDSSAPRIDVVIDRTDPARFVILFLFGVAVTIGFLAYLVAGLERAACGTRCAGRPAGYRDALYWLLSQLTFRGDPEGLSPATPFAQNVGLLLAPLGVTMLGVFIMAGVYSARINSKNFGEFGQGVMNIMSELDKAAWGSVFINYRQSHENLTVATLHRILAERFGPDKVFQDFRSMLPGTRYPDELRAKLNASAVLLAVIHQDWLHSLRQRQHAAGPDWVRYEISIALDTGKTVIPVLLENASLPTIADLSDDADLSIADLARQQVSRLRATSLDEDITRLVRAIEPYLRVSPGSAP